MANTNAPFGFRPLRRLDGAAGNFSSDVYQLAYNYGTAIYSGDVVIQLDTGYVAAAATTDAPIFGIFAGCEYYDSAAQTKLFMPYWSAPSTAVAPVTAYVITDTKQVFEVQSNGAALTVANVGENINFATGTGNVYSGQSGQTVNASSLNTTNTLPFRIVGLSNKIGVDNTSSYNIVQVVLNDSQYNQLTGRA